MVIPNKSKRTVIVANLNYFNVCFPFIHIDSDGWPSLSAFTLGVGL